MLRLVWRKRRWSCNEPGCATKSVTEESELVEGSLTSRAAMKICRRVGEGAHSLAQVARELSASWGTAAVRRHGELLVEDPSPSMVWSPRRRRARDARRVADRHHLLGTSFVDIGRGRLLDVVPGRNADDVASWCVGATPSWKAAVRVVAIDPHRGDANGPVRGRPDAIVTVDHFHAITLANEAVNDVRAAQDSRRSAFEDLATIPSTRRLMPRGFERLAFRPRGRLCCALRTGDPNGKVGATILDKELLHKVYAAKDRLVARRRLEAFSAHVAWAQVLALTCLATTVRAWEAEILNFHLTRASNGATEAQDLVTEKLRRIAHGVRTFSNCRLRLLLHSDVEGEARSTARIRGRPPRLVASSPQSLPTASTCAPCSNMSPSLFRPMTRRPAA